jgi:hypothetical protein
MEADKDMGIVVALLRGILAWKVAVNVGSEFSNNFNLQTRSRV